LSHCQVADDDPVEPRLEGAGWPEVVQRKRDEDGVCGEDFAGELLGQGAGGGLLRGALGRGDELGGDGDVVKVRYRVDGQVAVGDCPVRVLGPPALGVVG
jgi:hypothetical protein